MSAQNQLCIVALIVAIAIPMIWLYFCLILSGRISREEERRERKEMRNPPKETT